MTHFFFNRPCKLTLFFSFQLQLSITSNCISKEVTRHKDVTNIITQALVNVENEYICGNTDWPNGTQSDILLEPRPNNNLPPIIVEFQQVLDKEFMKRAVNYCLQAYKRFDRLYFADCLNQPYLK